jgi:cyclopropane-fatty-acyl-phospholipid synthase
VLTSLLRRIRSGTVIVTDNEGQHRFGRGTPEVRVAVHDSRVYEAVARSGSVGLGATYADGWWDVDDLTVFIQILERSLRGFGERADRFARIMSPLRDRLSKSEPRNNQKDKDNIRAHYDLSNDFFELMLDETLSYSCAYFGDPSVSLLDASVAKIDRLCRKLRLSDQDHLLEIGTGWGGFAIHAAKNFGCRVTTTTISDAQFEFASQRVHDAGQSGHVTVLNENYLDLTGAYDKVVSVEMIEAVGWRQMDSYFLNCERLLKPEGLMGLQAIVIDDRSYERAKHHDDFIKHFIFPGGFLPSIESMTRSMTGHSDLRVVDLEDIGVHYVETLRRWRSNLETNADAVKGLGFTEDFSRRWDFYLSYCEAAFIERHVSDVQLVLARSQWRDSLVAPNVRF